MAYTMGAGRKRFSTGRHGETPEETDMQASEQKTVDNGIRVREQRVADLTEDLDEFLSKYGKSDRVVMMYQDMLEDATRELAQYRMKLGL